jgi:L-alanine-DL-glutamate epimerase-like enolase superfamily enzyme
MCAKVVWIVRVGERLLELGGGDANRLQPCSQGRHVRRASKYIEGQKFVGEIVERFKALPERVGSGVDIAIDFHGAVEPPTASLLCDRGNALAARLEIRD